MATARLLSVALLAAVASCLPRSPAQPKREPVAAPLLPDVRTASGRPPVVLVSREGDPATVVALAVSTVGLGWTDGSSDDPEPATALAGLLEARLRAKSFDAVVTPSWDGVRASVLGGDATRIAASLFEALNAPATEGDLVAARRKLAALGQRPLRDRALARWARCVGQPHALPERAGKDQELDLARLERWRGATAGIGRVAVAVTAPSATAESVAAALLGGPEWKDAAPVAPGTDGTEPSVDVFEAATSSAVPVLHATLDVGTSSAAVTTAEALGDPRGPLAARLSQLDLPFRLREVVGAAHARGGCVGVVLEAAPSTQSGPAGTDLANRVADAVALVHLEASVFLAEPSTGATIEGAPVRGLVDGRTLSRLTGDAREAAERAAWWALADRIAPRPGPGSVALALPTRRGVKEAPVEPPRDALASAIARAEARWNKPIVEARTRVETGQGEAWVLVGSPCGTDAETEADAGLTALFVTAAADVAKGLGDVAVEPWVASDGAGIVVHGPALMGETPSAHARRLADIGARSFAAEPIPSSVLVRARADLLQRDARNDGATLAILAGALAPQHPSWVVPWGASEPLARSADSAVLLRAQALRGGPLRVAVLANTDTSQAEAAVRAADRWVSRHASDTRTCRTPSGAQPPRPGTYASVPAPGSVPEAYLAFPLPPGDETAYRAATLVAVALSEGTGALLEKVVIDGSSLAREASAHVLGWPRSPALVVRVVAPQASLDASVMQARALLERLHKGGLPAPDYERATAAQGRGATTRLLDPRARVVATWRGDTTLTTPSARPSADEVRGFAQKHLAEDAMVVVAARPPRPPATP